MASYEFSEEFQRDILRIAVADPGFLFQFRRALDPQFFTEPIHVTIAEAVLGVFDTVGEPPGVGLCLEAFSDYMDAGLDEMEVEDEIRRIYDDGLPRDAVEISQRTVTFARHQRLQSLIIDSGSYLKEGRFDDFEAAVRDAGMLESDVDGALYDYFDRMEERLKLAMTRAGEAIGLGVSTVDNHLEDGGIAPGEMLLFVGLPGYGKTTSLVNVGANAVKNGKKVFHASIGDMTERKVGLRYDAHFTGKPASWCRLNPRLAKDAVEGVLGDAENVGGLKIQYWPAYRARVSDIERKLRWLKTRLAWSPDLVVIDYGMNLLPRGPMSNYAGHERYEEIYKDCRSLGSVVGARVFGGIQANREAFQALREDRPIGQDNVAGSMGPARDADVAIAIMMTKEERDNGTIRYHGAKVREGQAEWTETCAVDFPTHTIRPADDFDEDVEPVMGPPRRRRRA